MCSRKAFTLLELMVVVMVLGLIAAVVVPQFSNAAAEARASALIENLRLLRTQIAFFQGHHNGVAPGYPNCNVELSPTPELFIAQMTQASNVNGDTDAGPDEDYPYGPYLDKFPINPVNGKVTVQIVSNDQSIPDESDNSHGWIYQPATLTFKADCTGTDEFGRAYFDY